MADATPNPSDFWAEYEGEVPVDLGHGFTAYLKRCLSADEAARCDAILVAPIMKADPAERTSTISTDVQGSNMERVVLSLLRWDLVDRSGQEMPLSPEKVKRTTLKALPEPVFKLLLDKIDELNKGRSPEEQRSFRRED